MQRWAFSVAKTENSMNTYLIQSMMPRHYCSWTDLEDKDVFPQLVGTIWKTERPLYSKN